MEHSKFAGLNVHGVVSFTYADADERTAVPAADFTEEDVSRIAKQLDDSSLWMLMSMDPVVVWKLLDSAQWDVDDVLYAPSYIVPGRGTFFISTGNNVPLTVDVKAPNWVVDGFLFGVNTPYRVKDSITGVRFMWHPAVGDDDAYIEIQNTAPAPTWQQGVDLYFPANVKIGYGLQIVVDGDGFHLINALPTPSVWDVPVFGLLVPSEVHSGTGISFTFLTGVLSINNTAPFPGYGTDGSHAAVGNDSRITGALQKSGGQMSGDIDSNGHAITQVNNQSASGSLASSAAATVLDWVIGPGGTDEQIHVTVGLRVLLYNSENTALSGSLDLVADYNITYDSGGVASAALMGTFSPDYSRLPATLNDVVLTVVTSTTNHILFKIAAPLADISTVGFIARRFVNFMDGLA